jgi:hypothetical protein
MRWGRPPRRSFWGGRDGSFGPALVQHLVALTGPLTTVAQQHFAYPALHYFRSRDAEESARLASAVLDDALLLLTFVVCPSVAPERTAVQPARRAISRYIRTAGTGSALPSVEGPPPLPSVARLRDAGIPLRVGGWPDGERASEADRRRRLQQLVREANWSWPTS